MRTNVVGSKLTTRFCVASLLPILARPVSSKVKYRWTGRDERSEAVRDFRFFRILREYRTVYRSVRLPIACVFIRRDSSIGRFFPTSIHAPCISRVVRFFRAGDRATILARKVGKRKKKKREDSGRSLR